MNATKIFSFLGIALLFSSCNNAETLKTNLNEHKHKSTCGMISEKLITKTFGLSTETPIKKKETYSACIISWEEEDKNHTINLSFFSAQKEEEKVLNSYWEIQDKTIFKFEKQSTVHNVGDKASWTNIGEGQMRVKCNGLLFYMNYKIDDGSLGKIASKEETKMKIKKISILAIDLCRNL